MLRRRARPSGNSGPQSVTVVVATRNRRPSVERTIEHLLGLPERPEIIVVDNASHDGTPEIVTEMSERIRVVALPRNLGAAARNIGVSLARTSVVAFSDDDSWWEPGSLAHAASLFENHPQLGLIAATILVGDQRNIDPTCATMSASPLRTQVDAAGPRVLGFVACGSILRRSAFLEVGGFEPRFGIGAEEEQLALRLADQGWDLNYVREVIAHHHPARTNRDKHRDRYAIRNHLWASWLHDSVPSAVQSTMRVARRAVAERSARAGLVQAAGGLPWVIRERRPLRPSVERERRAVEAARGIS